MVGIAPRSQRRRGGSSARRPARAEVVGSLLRPAKLKAAIETFYETGHSAVLSEERAKDRSGSSNSRTRRSATSVRRQVDLGLDVVTDGEFRRWMFLNSFYDAVEGFRTDNVVHFRNARGEDVPLSVHEIVERLRPVRLAGRPRGGLHGRDLGRTSVQGDVPRGVDLRPPVLVQAGRDVGYEDLEAFVAHAIEIERQLVADAISAGARYVQFDFPLYPYLVDTAWVERFEEHGYDVDDLLDAAIAADLAVLEGIPDDVTTALHICRGNFRSSWMCEGSLESVAYRVFGELPYDSFLVEWDDLGRDGGYEPVRFLREGSTMVMGIVSTKTPVLEDEGDLMHRMEQAAHIAGGLDRLAISPQCGFASVMIGNEIDEETQWRKLELVARVADRLWSGV